LGSSWIISSHKHHLQLKLTTYFPAMKTISVIVSIMAFASLALASPMVIDKRTSCQLGSIGPANAGNAACSASVRDDTQPARWHPLLQPLPFV
jgi:hypothetical protein